MKCQISKCPFINKGYATVCDPLHPCMTAASKEIAALKRLVRSYGKAYGNAVGFCDVRAKWLRERAERLGCWKGGA